MDLGGRSDERRHWCIFCWILIINGEELLKISRHGLFEVRQVIICSQIGSFEDACHANTIFIEGDAAILKVIEYDQGMLRRDKETIAI